MNTEGRFIRKKDITDNVATFVYDYDSLGRLTAMSHTSDGFEESYAYEYDVAGNRLKTTKTSVRDGISNSSIYEYGYDELYYLTEVKRNGLNQYMYCYDSPLRYIDPSGNFYECVE